MDLAIPEYGYKNHVGIDQKHGLIRTYEVTSASCYDGHKLEEVLDPTNTASAVWADSAYRSQENEKMLADKGYTSHIHRKKPKAKPMPKNIAKANHKKSLIRAKVEHVFAHTKHHGALFIRTIGLKRAEVKIGLANLVYNMKRFIFLQRRHSQEQCV